MSDFLQFVFSGLTVGAIYALVGIGFALIYNASHVINFAQGEFVMIGGMATVALIDLGVPLLPAALVAIAIAALVGVALEKLAIEPARNAGVVTLIIITIGASILVRGVVEVVLGKQFHRLPSFSGDQPILVGGATLHPQSLWIVGALVVLVVGLKLFFDRHPFGKAILATAHNRLAAQLVGIEVKTVLVASFALSAAFGAIGGILTAPLTLTQYDVGVMLGVKGFCAAILGGLGSPFGAVLGGLIVGLAEALAAGYVSSAYKDVVAFVMILLVLFFMPSGLFGTKGTERV
ncbi:MAG: branched-chain amino acid ABC transporter permease [Alphaproteobacteria bacterium]|jgi:branched-chain amino acid transport system permease protein|nr:branched-chain amino acid ABC transporter permease [Alphaproteobacteria bacterium]